MSDDYVEYTWHAPTARFIGRPMLEKVDKNSEHIYPMWVWNTLGGKAECIDPMIMTSAKVIAYSMLDLFTCKDLLHKAKEEFFERTGGGIGGSKWLAPLIEPNNPVPVKLSVA